MTAFPGAGTALDRIGGRVVLEGRLRDLEPRRRREVEIHVGDSPTHYTLGLFDGDGHFFGELRSVQIAHSRAVSADQLSLLVADMKELRPLVAEIVAAIEEEEVPESEKRLLDGNR